MQFALNKSPAFPFLLIGAFLAVALPTLIAYNTTPSATFLNQICAYIGWGGFGFWVCAVLPALTGTVDSGPTLRAEQVGRLRWTGEHAAVLAGAAVLAASAWGSHLVHGLPLGLTLQALGVLSAAALVFLLGAWSARQPHGPQVLRAVLWALALTGLLGLLIGAIQVFRPQWADGQWLARSVVAGRAVGNVRQPNHLSTLLLWAAAACVWLGEARPARRPWAQAAIVGLCVGVVWTASRTGMVGVGMLALWGLIDRSLSRPMRIGLCLTPLVYGAAWGGMWWLQQHYGLAFASEARLHDHSDISSSRFAIWSNTLDLIRAHPWTGVGFGEFNLAWTLTPFPHRPIAFFDHTHNIFLQFLVELGLPLTLGLTILLGSGVVGLVRRAIAGDGASDGAFGRPTAAALLYIVALAGVHSLLEYPLWYTYFLLPTCFCWGFGLVRVLAPSGAQAAQAPRAARPWAVDALNTGFVLMVFTGVWSVIQYGIAEDVFVGSAHDAPLEVRIERAQRSLLFDYQADYAQATTSEDPSAVLRAIRQPLHNLIDARLLAAYARALGEVGELDKAWYVADRLREFHHPLGDEFFAECKDFGPADDDRPFQCLPRPPAVHHYDFNAFRP